MVGVPGKSKGCSTCRRRKKGCDQKRPVCGQCSSSGYVCGGYQRDLTFITHPATKALKNAVFVPVRPAPPQLIAAPSLERSLVITQCKSLFFEVFMPWGRCLCRDEQILRCRHPMNITEVIPLIPKDEASLDAAFSALSISRVGRNRNDQRLVKESSKFYGKALKGLQRALTDPNRMHSEHVLAACLLLTYYEVFEDSSGQSLGWASHAQGVARVLQLRGPTSHQLDNAHQLFLAARQPIIYASMLRRKRTFLEEKDWLEIPWAQARFRTGLDILVDIAVRVPGLMESLDNIKAGIPVPEQRPYLIDCLESCIAVQQRLKIWEIRRKPGSAPFITAHEFEDPLDDYPFEHDIIFANHLFFNANLIHWASHLLVAMTVAELQTLIAELTNPRSDNSQAIVLAREQAHQAATNIAQSIPYALLPDMGDLGISHITFPMTLVHSYFASTNNTRVCTWLSKTQAKVKHMGLNIGPIDKGALASTFNAGLRINNGQESMLDLSTTSVSQSERSTNSDIDVKSDYTKSTSWESDFSSKLSASQVLPQSQGSPLPIHHPRSGPQTGQVTDDYDPVYDAESDFEGSSPKSPDYSGGSRQSSITSVPKQLQQIQRANASRGEYTFVEEDPSGHYVIAAQGKKASIDSGKQYAKGESI